VRIEFSAGYDDIAVVPPPIKQAALVLIAALYANRGDKESDGSITDVMRSLRWLLASYKDWNFG
jgi:hypothetical protein